MSDTNDPIIEQIVDYVVKSLASISVTNDYRNDVTKVERPNPALGNTLMDRRLVVFQGNPSRPDDEPLGHDEWLMPLSIVCQVVESENSTTPIDKRLNTLRADVEKRLVADNTARTCGGLAIDTTIAEPEYAPISPAAHEGEVCVNAIIHFRTAEDDPYTQ